MFGFAMLLSASSSKPCLRYPKASVDLGLCLVGVRAATPLPLAANVSPAPKNMLHHCLDSGQKIPIGTQVAYLLVEHQDVPGADESVPDIYCSVFSAVL